MAEYIEREDAIEAVEDQCVDGKMFGGDETGMTLVDAYDCIDAIGDIPAADVEPVKHESWNRVEVSRDGCLHVLYVCSGCNDYIGMTKENDIGIWTIRGNYCYCRKCGAKMDAEG